MVIIPAIKDHNEMNITDIPEETNILNSYYSSNFSCDHNFQEIKFANFFIYNNFITKTNEYGQMKFLMKFWNWLGKSWFLPS